MNSDEYTILLVGDNPDDVLIARRALSKAGVANPIQIVEDGQAAIDYLAGKGEYADRESFPIPILVLLDLNMPHKSGFDVLAWMKKQGNLEEVPVVVLTSSTDRRDTERAYSLGANSYLVKPLTPNEVWDTLKSLSLYWSSVVLIRR